MKVSGVGDGVRVRLAMPEADTLSTLVADLVNALQPTALDADDPVYRRLFPDGYQDNPEAAAAFRALTEQGLRDDRLDRARQCLADLAAVSGPGRRIDVTLGAEAAERWIQVLNDMRLAIGTRIGVSEDDSYVDIDPRQPEAMPRAVYAYLTGVQDAVVRALMR